MTLKTALLILCSIIYDTQCNENTTDPLDYYEFRLKHGDRINYEELVGKVNGKNKTISDEVYGTDWHDFTDNTHILLNLPGEQEANESTTATPNNFWNIVQGAQMLTFGGNDDWHRTSMLPGDETWTYQDLTDGLTLFANYTLENERLYNESLLATRTTERSEELTTPSVDIRDHTDNDVFFNANDSWLDQFSFNTSEEDRKLNIEDFLKFTVTTVSPPSTTWNPFLIQSEERIELDRIAKEKRMATNNMVRDQIKSGQFGGLGGLFGGLGGVIPINLGGLGGLMGGLRTITLVMGGGGGKSTTQGITTTAKSTISRKTFKPRPNPQDFMAWKFLEDGSPRPPMAEDEFIRILKKHGTPPPYYVPPISIPAGLGEDLLDLLPNENTTIAITIEPEQLDRIHNFINPFIQQHTAMDLLDVNHVGRFTEPPSTRRIRHTDVEETVRTTTTTTTTTTRRTAETGIFTTRLQHKPLDDSWKQGWSRTPNTIDPFDTKNLQHALNEGVKGDHPWREVGFKTVGTIAPSSDPRLAELEKDFVAVNFKEEQAKRVSQAIEAKDEMERRHQKYKERSTSKPPYWKEVIFRRPIQPLYEETSTAPKTAELIHLFSILSQGITTDHPSTTTDKPTTTTKPRILTSQTYFSFEPSHSTTRLFHSMYWTLDERNAPLSAETHRNQPSSHKIQRNHPSVHETWQKDKWTTPREERERLATLLSFMFPYIQKKSDIFGTVHEDAQTSTTSTTDFDPWGSESEGRTETPIMPELGRLFERLAVNYTRY